MNVCAYAQPTLDDLVLSQLPSWSQATLQEETFRNAYLFDPSVNPFFQSGDFDGDGFLDLAVLVREAETGKRGVALLLQDGSLPLVLGAGDDGNPAGADWSWLAFWHVERRLPAGAGLEHEGHVLVLAGLDGTSLWVFRTADGWQVAP